MAASPYLLRILSKPIRENVSSWLEWYQTEGLPKTIAKTNAVRGGLYQAYNTFELATKTPLDTKATNLHEVQVSHIDLEPPADKTCLALCQINSIDAVETLFKAATPPQDGPHSAISDIRVYRLIEDFDPRGLGHRQYPNALSRYDNEN